jgi:hypothetical protein
MTGTLARSEKQKGSEAAVDAYRKHLGLLLAAESHKGASIALRISSGTLPNCSAFHTRAGG